MKHIRRFVVIVLAAPILYLASKGPAVGIWWGYGRSDLGRRILLVFYAPVNSLDFPPWADNAAGVYIEICVDVIEATWPATPMLIAAVIAALVILSTVRLVNRRDNPRRCQPSLAESRFHA